MRASNHVVPLTFAWSCTVKTFPVALSDLEMVLQSHYGGTMARLTDSILNVDGITAADHVCFQDMQVVNLCTSSGAPVHSRTMETDFQFLL